MLCSTARHYKNLQEKQKKAHEKKCLRLVWDSCVSYKLTQEPKLASREYYVETDLSQLEA